jgi:hypothetical protein
MCVNARAGLLAAESAQYARFPPFCRDAVSYLGFLSSRREVVLHSEDFADFRERSRASRA